MICESIVCRAILFFNLSTSRTFYRRHTNKLGLEISNVCILLKAWYKRWRQLLHLKSLPTNGCKPGMSFNSFTFGWPTAQSLIRVFYEKFLQQIYTEFRHIAWILQLSTGYIMKQSISIFTVERRQTSNHLINQCSKRPPVNCFPMTCSIYDFDSQIFWCAT